MGTRALPDMYALGPGPSGFWHIYQAKCMCPCQSLYIKFSAYYKPSNALYFNYSQNFKLSFNQLCTYWSIINVISYLQPQEDIYSPGNIEGKYCIKNGKQYNLNGNYTLISLE